MNSRCRSCGAEIKWIKMASRKMMPVNVRQIRYNPASLSDEDALQQVERKGRWNERENMQ